MIDYMCACHDHAQTSASIRELLYIIGAETCYDVAISRAESLNGGEPAVQMNPLNNGETGQKIQKYRKSIKKPNLTVDFLILIAETIESLSASFLFEKYFFQGFRHGIIHHRIWILWKAISAGNLLSKSWFSQPSLRSRFLQN